MFYNVSLVGRTLVFGVVPALAFVLIQPHLLSLVVRYGIVGSMLQANNCHSSHFWKT